MKTCAQRKAGRIQWARRRFACRLYPSHGPLRFITSRSPKRSAWAGGWPGTNQMWDACWQRFEPRNIDFNKFLFQLQHSKVHSHARITNSVTIFTKQYMLIASAKNLKRYLQFNPDELQWLVANSTAKENGPTTSVVCTFFVYSHFNRLFPSFKIFHFQNEAQCKNFLVIMSPICMRIKRNFHINGFALSLALSFGQLWSLIDEIEKPNDTA